MKTSNKQKNLYLIVAILAITTLTFRLINDLKLEQTSILFVGVPTLLTLLLIKYVKSPKSAYGIALYTTTLFLLMCSILLGEGLICILMMAPLFYGIVTLIVFVVSWIKGKSKHEKLHSYVLTPLLLIIAQANQINKAPEIITINTSKIFNNPLVLEQLNQNPDFLKDFPSFFKMGFPKPISIEGKGIEKGDYRKINFLSETKGIGTLHIKIVEKTTDKIRFKVVEDTTHMHHWLSLQEVTVLRKGNTVVWSTQFTCDLGPSWYFEPIERYAVDLMNKHLIQTYFAENGTISDLF